MRTWISVALGVLVGYFATALLSTAITELMRLMFAVARADDPPLYYRIFDLLYGVAFGGVGAWAGAMLVRRRIAAYVLATLTFVVVAVTAVAGWDTVHAIEYQWAAAVLTPVAMVIGGRLVPEGRPRGPHARRP